MTQAQYDWLMEVWCNIDINTSEYHLIHDILHRGWYNEDEKLWLNRHRASLDKEIK
jgi:hypothetical protein